MKDLIEALNIFLKYENNDYPTNCAHDELYVCLNNPEKVSEEDVEKLENLGFIYVEENGAFLSFKFGSC